MGGLSEIVSAKSKDSEARTNLVQSTENADWYRICKTDVTDSDVNYKKISQNFLCHSNENSGESAFQIGAN
jgi:hypothetical protein